MPLLPPNDKIRVVATPDRILGRRPAAPFALDPVALVADYLILALRPLAVAWVLVPEGGPVWPELATGLALVGYAVLLAQFILTGRWRPIGGRLGIAW